MTGVNYRPIFSARFKIDVLFHRLYDHIQATSTAVISSLMHTKELTHTEN